MTYYNWGISVAFIAESEKTSQIALISLPLTLNLHVPISGEERKII